ncbi:MAG: HEPN domain-containing protein [Thermoproteota archaeon]
MVERSSDWMDQAEWDLKHAKNDLESKFYDWACFSAQQSAEKALKAVFQKFGAEAWGHSVYDLLVNLKERERISDELLECALELDKAYIPARYPNAHPSSSPRKRYVKNEADRMIRNAEKILEFCKSVLSRV